jgi:hypothetical protein
MAADKWVLPDLIFLPIFILSRTYKFKMEVFPCSKISKLCMVLDLNILNNFLNEVNLKFSTKFML